MSDIVAFAFKLIILHLLSGQAIEVNGDQISTLAYNRKGSTLVPAGCIVHMLNRTFITVQEKCEDIGKMLRENP
jgi:hypothetical protein